MSPLWFPYSQMQTMPPPLKVKSASGVMLKLEDGRELIDAISSWWCVIHGYSHPEINAAINEQMQKFSHVMLGGLTHQPAEELAKELVRITPQGLDYVFFADSGSVGMEVAMKMAAQFWKNCGVEGKHKFACLYKGYHGDTTGVMSISDPEEGMHHLFKGFLTKQFFISPPSLQPAASESSSVERNELRGDSKSSASVETSLQEMESLFKSHSSEIAAFVCEPLLQGAGGFNFYPPQFLTGAKELCDKYNILWIADEVATGFGRTGTMFACEQANATPDIMVLGKGLTAGYLGLSATLATKEIYNSFLGKTYEKAFMHGPTFMGNALACSAALASIKIFERENYLAKNPNSRKNSNENFASENCGEKQEPQNENAAQQGGTSKIARINEILQEELLGFKAKGVKETRVLGACGVIETKSETDHKGIQEFAAKRGVWLRPFLKVVYAMPPYIISESELRKVCCVMKEFFANSELRECSKNRNVCSHNNKKNKSLLSANSARLSEENFVPPQKGKNISQQNANPAPPQKGNSASQQNTLTPKQNAPIPLQAAT